jgi:hypothetical protein
MLSRENIRIENSRLYPSEIVGRLHAALSSGAELRANESRINFYHVNVGARTYFTCISPASGKVPLIATWGQKGGSTDVGSDEHPRWWQRIAEHLPSGNHSSCGCAASCTKGPQTHSDGDELSWMVLCTEPKPQSLRQRSYLCCQTCCVSLQFAAQPCVPALASKYNYFTTANSTLRLNFESSVPLCEMTPN